MTRFDKVSRNTDPALRHKYDMQLGKALKAEDEIADIFQNAKIELKTETWQWRRTGNIAIEYQRDGQPSGIASTEADFWAHELRDDDETTLGYFLISVSRLKEICRSNYKLGNCHEGGGDGGRFCNVLIPVKELLKCLK